MKTNTLITLILISFCFSQKTLAQEAFITQYEFAPTYLNPSFTGDTDASIRILSTYINQWPSSLGENSYKTGVLSIDTKFSIGESNVLGIGLLTYLDKAGSANYRNNKFSLSASIAHYFNKSDDTYNAIVLGVDFGQAIRKIDGNVSGVLNKINYLDLGSGILWKLKLKSGLKIQLGYALLHLNSPNVSFFENHEYKLKPRANLHVDAEISLTSRFSILPSYISSSQGLSKQHMMSLSNRIYFNTSNYQNWVQLSFFGKLSKPYTTESFFHTYGVSSIFTWKSLKFGISVGHHIQLDDNTFEFSFGYQLVKKKLNGYEIAFNN